MDALTILRQEHSALLRELFELDQQLTSLESSGPIKGTRVLKELAETERGMRSSLELHMRKEERGLFPILETKLGQDRELVDVMKSEHAELLGSLDSFKKELERMNSEHDTRKTWNLASKLQELRGGLSDHMSREDRVLFWLAELRLSWLDQRKIASSLSDLQPKPYT